MSAQKLGGRLRRIRQEHRLTQAGMAERLGISPSYLNLLENNQRGVTVAVLLKLAQRFEVDLQSLTVEDDRQLGSDLTEIFADPLFDGHALRRSDLDELATNMPHLGRAILTLYQAMRGARTQSPAAQGLDEELPTGMPSEEVADFIQGRENYFPKLEDAAAALWRDAGLAPHDLYNRLVVHLSARHGVDTTIQPAARMGGRVRHYDPAAMRLSLCESLPGPSRVFQLLHQYAVLALRPVIDGLVGGGKFTTDVAEQLARVSLRNYFAGAVMMPYDALIAAARDCRYDIDVLKQRFDASFEQVCHRLTELRKPGSAGVPFHFLKVDAAGNTMKRFGGSGITMPRFGGACPRWNVFDAFGTPGRVLTQVSRMPDGSEFICLARTVGAPGPFRANRPGGRTGLARAIGLGCSIAYARELVHADGIDLDDPAGITPIGVSCRVCERLDCSDRAMPARHHPLLVNEHVRGASPFGLGAPTA